MTLMACQYSIAQFLPYAETGEFANVGVVLVCPSQCFMGAQFLSTKKTARITSFFDRLDKRVYRTLKVFWRMTSGELSSWQNDGNISSLPVADLFDHAKRYFALARPGL